MSDPNKEPKEPGRPAPFVSENSGQDAPAPLGTPFFDPYGEIDLTENYLPHWQQGEVWTFVTWRLGDSLPADKLSLWLSEKEIWLGTHPEPWDAVTIREYHTQFTQRMEDWLDAGEGSCLLREPALRLIVVNALRCFHDERYEMDDFMVMPNHLHVLFRPLENHTLPRILHSWKSFTSNGINKAAGRQGVLWQEDYWDRLIRNDRHLEACRRYIAENPLKARLKGGEYTLSSKEPGYPAPESS